jgi:uncharacterized protein YqjF (DUF2071 family)
VAWPMVYQSWRTFTFLHWAYEPADVQRLLPSVLKVHTFDGVAWGGAHPFSPVRVSARQGSRRPGLSSFPETNVRIYVVDRNGLDACGFCPSKHQCWPLSLAHAPVCGFLTIGRP